MVHFKEIIATNIPHLNTEAINRPDDYETIKPNSIGEIGTDGYRPNGVVYTSSNSPDLMYMSYCMVYGNN
jgi:hypothetical protein